MPFLDGIVFTTLTFTTAGEVYSAKDEKLGKSFESIPEKENAVDEIKKALSSDFESEELEDASEKFKVIRDKVAIYVLEDPQGDSDSENVFSWDIMKYLEQ